MIEAQQSFRRINGCKEMKSLVDTVLAEVAARIAEEKGETHPPRTIRPQPEQLWDRHPKPTELGASSSTREFARLADPVDTSDQTLKVSATDHGVRWCCHAPTVRSSGGARCVP